MKPGHATALLALLLAVPPDASAQTTTVFSTDFQTAIPPQISAPGCVREGCQGYSGLGPTGYQFSGNFLRYNAVPLHDTILTLNNLPPHDHINLRFLLAVIDSWDGTELLQVLVDGSPRFNHWFQLATGDASSYTAPAGGLLSSGVNLGFSNGSFYMRDRAYNMALEPALLNIPHTASSITIIWRISAVSGPAAGQWQGGTDESWAMDGVAVDVINTPPSLDRFIQSAAGIGVVAGPIGLAGALGQSVVGSATAGTQTINLGYWSGGGGLAVSDVPAVVIVPEAPPVRTGLLSSRPNPTLGIVRIAFELAPRAAGPVLIQLFSATGRLVRTVVDGELSAGRHEVVWDGRDERGQPVPSGVYFTRLTTPNTRDSGKLQVIR